MVDIKPQRSLTLFILNILILTHLHGQQNHYVNYSKDLSIPAIMIWDMEKDRDGLFWFITHKGIMSYDGIEWTLMPDSLKLPSREKSRIKALTDGRIVACGFNNDNEFVLSVLKDNKWESSLVPGGWNNYSNIIIHQKNNADPFEIYFNAQDSLFTYSEIDNSWKLTSLPDPFDDRTYLKNIKFIDGNYYFLTKTGIYLWKNNKLQENSLGVSEIDNEPVYDLYFSHNKDTIVTILEKSLFYKIKGETKRVTSPNLHIYNDFIFSTLTISGQHIYYTSSGALYLYDLSSNLQRELHAHNDRILPFFSDFKLDSQNNLWVTNPRGISKISNLAFTNYTRKDGLQENEISVILHLKNGHHFIGHNYGFSVMNQNLEIVWKEEFEKNEINRAQDGIVLNDDQVLIANSNKGLLLIDTKNRTIKNSTPEGLRFANSVQKIGDTLWVNDLANAYGYYKGQKFYQNRTVARRIYSLNEHELIFLRNNGFFIANKSNPDHGAINIQNNLNLYSLSTYKDKTIISALDGLYELVGNEMIPFNYEGEINKIGIYGLAQESYDKLWVGTSEGIFLIDSDSVMMRFDISAGLIGNEINRAAMSIDFQNRLWVGTPEGMSIIELNHLDQKSIPPSPHFLEMHIQGESVDPFQLPEFSYNENAMSIKVAALNFKNERKINYRYRMHGLDREWQLIDNPLNRFIRYDFLPPGNYQFELQVREEGGKWSQSLMTSEWIIQDPYYYQAWFIIMVTLLTVGGVYLIVRFYTYGKMNKMLEYRLDEKMREVYKYQENLKSQNKELEEKNNELDTLVYSISHDLRAPILSALGLVNIYQLAKSDEERKTYVQMMETSLTRLDGFIQNILKISRNARLDINKITFDLQEFLNELVEAQKHRDEAANIKFEVKANNLSILTDKDRLGMIIMNLISNAIIYSDTRKEQSLIRVSAKIDNSIIEISVYDNGTGIREDYLNDIFKIFVRANETKTGSGLGLYIAQQSAQKIGAEISVQSSFGEWTEFKITLPVS